MLLILFYFDFSGNILDRECPELPQPEMGSVNMTGREFGGKAIYTCPIGYNVIGVTFQHTKQYHLNEGTIFYISVFFLFFYSLQQDCAAMVNGQERSQFAQRTVKHLFLFFSSIFKKFFPIKFELIVILCHSHSFLFDTTRY